MISIESNYLTLGMQVKCLDDLGCYGTAGRSLGNRPTADGTAISGSQSTDRSKFTLLSLDSSIESFEFLGDACWQLRADLSVVPILI